MVDWKSRGAPIVCLLLLGSCVVGSQPMPPKVSSSVGCEALAPLASGLAAAFEAATLAQRAATVEAWHQVVWRWTEAIAHLQRLPPDHPQWAYAQKKVQEYQGNLAIAQRYAEATAQLPFPSFNHPMFNAQLQLYWSYQASFGTPDVLIIGSSRALQGIDPQRLQAAITSPEGEPLRVFNLSINGLTAQSIDLLLREVLTLEQLPKLILWGDGVRSLNSSRPDATHETLIASPGYQRLQGDQHLAPIIPPPPLTFLPCPETTSRFFAYAADVERINAQGFLAVPTTFNPERYYQTVPRVPGLYDRDYQRLNLIGNQTAAFDRLWAYLREHQRHLILINLPVTASYLDATRQQVEAEFQTFMATKANQEGWQFLDLSRQWLNNSSYFADPTHLNQTGATQLSQQLSDRVIQTLTGRSISTPHPIPSPRLQLPPPP